MVDPVVRPATVADAAVLAELERRARDEIGALRGGPRLLAEHPAIASAWSTLVADPGCWVAVGTIDEVIVGYLVLRLSAGEVATVDQVWVEPGAREVGFGDELLERATVAARASGAIYLDATVLPGDRASKNLYERAGITARMITVSRALDA